MNPTFEAFAFSSVTNARFDNTCVHVVTGHHFFHFNEGTYFVYVWKGLAWHNSDIPLRAGMYGCFNIGHIQTDHGSKVLIIQCMDYNGMRTFGGPIEKTGRLKYIDGCTDSLLIPPVKKGDPCLNHLHFPAGIEQTMHTHPSIRIGVVSRGAGECVTPWANIELKEGMIFVIRPEDGSKVEGFLVGSHCFRTLDKSMDIIAFHPDTDFGPTDEDHPMINRTIVNGVSASNLEDIHTK